MSHSAKDAIGVIATITSASGTIVGWQSQLEFWLRIISLFVGIAAGLYSIWHYSRKR
jgi:hypothetical protein